MLDIVVDRDGPWLTLDIKQDGNAAVTLRFDRKNAWDVIGAMQTVLGCMGDEPYVIEDEKDS